MSLTFRWAASDDHIDRGVGGMCSCGCCKRRKDGNGCIHVEDSLCSCRKLKGYFGGEKKTEILGKECKELDSG
jgi:hypothetical protein